MKKNKIISADDIAKRAFEIYLSRGCVDGFAEQDWAKAEAELTAQAAEKTTEKSKEKFVNGSGAKLKTTKKSSSPGRRPNLAR